MLRKCGEILHWQKRKREHEEGKEEESLFCVNNKNRKKSHGFMLQEGNIRFNIKTYYSIGAIQQLDV